MTTLTPTAPCPSPARPAAPDSAQAGSFAAYAATRIRGAILDELRRLDWMSRSSRSKAKRLGSALSRLEQAQGGAVTPESLHDLIADDGTASAGELVERKELVGLLAGRIAQLPEMPRKVLAMYYYENLRLADIAAAFGLTESRICQIHTQAVKQLRAYLQSVMA
jgi:RNA polymerase sigma factor for flagellar operon FliA